MRALFNSIENVKAKPHHVRRQVVFTVAGGVTALIALAWLVSSLSTGSFALKPSSFADAGVPQTNTDGVSSSQVAGVAASVREEASNGIIVVDAPKAQPKAAEPTVIPF